MYCSRYNSFSNIMSNLYITVCCQYQYFYTPNVRSLVSRHSVKLHLLITNQVQTNVCNSCESHLFILLLYLLLCLFLLADYSLLAPILFYFSCIQLAFLVIHAEYLIIIFYLCIFIIINL